MSGWARYAALAATVVVMAVGGWYLLGSPRGVGGPAGSPSPTVTESASVSPSPVASPVTFTSPSYGYTVTLPAGWSATAATKVWDGKGAPGSEDPAVDKFHGVGSKTVHALVAPTSLDLSAYGDEVIARLRSFTPSARRRPSQSSRRPSDRMRPRSSPGTAGSWSTSSWGCTVIRAISSFSATRASIRRPTRQIGRRSSRCSTRCRSDRSGLTTRPPLAGCSSASTSDRRSSRPPWRSARPCCSTWLHAMAVSRTSVRRSPTRPSYIGPGRRSTALDRCSGSSRR